MSFVGRHNPTTDVIVTKARVQTKSKYLGPGSEVRSQSHAFVAQVSGQAAKHPETSRKARDTTQDHPESTQSHPSDPDELLSILIRCTCVFRSLMGGVAMGSSLVLSSRKTAKPEDRSRKAAKDRRRPCHKGVIAWTPHSEEACAKSQRRKSTRH